MVRDRYSVNLNGVRSHRSSGLAVLSGNREISNNGNLAITEDCWGLQQNPIQITETLAVTDTMYFFLIISGVFFYIRGRKYRSISAFRAKTVSEWLDSQ